MKILKVISEIYGVSVDGVISKILASPLPEARHIVVWYLVRCEGWKLADAGNVVNMKHMNTLNSVRKIEGMRNYDKQIRNNIHKLLIRMRDVSVDKMDTYVISRAFPWSNNMEIQILSDGIYYAEMGTVHSGCKVMNQNNEDEIHKKCQQIADLIRDIEKLNIV